jgi:hypothetical protein
VGSGPSEKKFFRPCSEVGLAKNLDTKLERLTLSCGVTKAWSERVDLYSQQIATMLIKMKKCAT